MAGERKQNPAAGKMTRSFLGREKAKTGGRSKEKKNADAGSDTFLESLTFDTGRKDAGKDGKSKGKREERQAGKARSKVTYSMEKVYDEKTGAYTYKVVAGEKDRMVNPSPLRKKRAGKLMAEAALLSRETFQKDRDDNDAVTAADDAATVTLAGSKGLYEFAKSHSKSRAQRKYDRLIRIRKTKVQEAAGDGQRRFEYDTKEAYEKWLKENAKNKEQGVSDSFNKEIRKAKIKRKYQKARKAQAASEQATEAATTAAKTTTAVAKKLQEIASAHAKGILVIAFFAVLLVMLMTMFVSCGAMLGNSVSTTMASTYLSEPAQIDAADLVMTRFEMELQTKIDNIETDYPDYDEYDYNLGEIGHNPMTLISFLSAEHVEFQASDVEAEIEALFQEMYTLTLTPDSEIRTRTVTGTRTVVDPIAGSETIEEYEYEEEYEVSILRVVLEVKPLEEIVLSKLSAEQAGMYALYGETKGDLQIFASPVDYYWYNYVSSYYGYRKNPATMEEEYHRGVDIAMPEGTTVYATHAGTIAEAGYDAYFGNYVVITDTNGYTTKYGHLSTLNVSAGETVRKGRVIGKTGNTGTSTGSHLHFECMHNGEYYNPLFYFLAGNQTMYGENTGGSGATDIDIPDAYGDEKVAALFAEGNRYVGMDYVWGGSKPSTGFDCSGFVCYVFKNSGVYPLERTTAQGIYNQCVRVDASEAQAGDLIFFTGTYSSGNPVTHVGIYCGNGIMLHCGDPIKYARINTSYWQSHFYAFGRLAQ